MRTYIIGCKDRHTAGCGRPFNIVPTRRRIKGIYRHPTKYGCRTSHKVANDWIIRPRILLRVHAGVRPALTLSLLVNLLCPTFGHTEGITRGGLVTLRLLCVSHRDASTTSHYRWRTRIGVGNTYFFITVVSKAGVVRTTCDLLACSLVEASRIGLSFRCRSGLTEKVAKSKS